MELAELYLDWSRLALEKLVAFALSPDACGYFASGLVLATFWMHRMVPLRMVAIGSNVAFFSYAMMLDIKPVAVLHALLLPVNIRRLCQLHANPWGKVAEVGKKLGPLAGYAALVGVVTVLLTVVPGGTVADGTFRCAAKFRARPRLCLQNVWRSCVCQSSGIGLRAPCDERWLAEARQALAVSSRAAAS